MPQSMTGFGAAEGPAGSGRLRVEIRTVNHRYFNFAPKLPGDLAPLEGEFRERLRREFDRGHIALSVRWLESAEREVTLTVDVDRARIIADRLRELQSAAALGGTVDLDLVARQPDVLRWDRSDDTVVPWSDIEPIVGDAAAECRTMRLREGDALVAELRHRLGLLAEGAAAIAARAPGRITRERDRLRAAIAELLDGRQADEQRIAQELAILADRLDITEELVRFGAHLAACEAALTAEAPSGKQLGFLAQELGREVNTMGAKANDAAITQHVIAMKGELEKFREQLENLQ
ncbi:MAG TPA: YicC/YloC family endoribonuclease [Gemmatimonadales bacterium]|nr:YicC/YloC family endoribonuclease [Gemmatimonadales bacterium]